MSETNTSSYLLLLGIITAISFALFGALYEAHISRPLAEAPPPLQDKTPLGLVLTGAQDAVNQAIVQISTGRRDEATRALDAALRSLEVTTFALQKSNNAGWQRAFMQTKKAKSALQNGSPAVMVKYLHTAAEILKNIQLPSTPQWADQPLEEHYAGATVLNAIGIRIGKINAIKKGTNQVEIVIGGVHDLFGFIEWGGKLIQRNKNQLIYGKAEWPKPIMVIVPTMHTKQEAILDDLNRIH